MMSSTRTLEERVTDKQAQLEKILETAKQYQEQIKKLECRRAEEDRKKSAHRLIEVGAAVESVLGMPIEHNDLPKLISYLRNQEEKGKYFSKALAKSDAYEIGSFED